MSTPGKLTAAGVSFSTPTDAPLYPPPPYTYPGATLLVVEFATDPARAAAILPARAELVPVPGHPELARAGLAFADYPASTLGPYREAILYLHATFDAGDGPRPLQYAARFYVTTDVAMAAGREQAGIPKKIGAIDLAGFDAPTLAPGQTLGGRLARPAGTPIASASGKLVPLTAPAGPNPTTFTYLSLRLVPSPTLNEAPSLSQLIETSWGLDVAEAFGVEPDRPPTFDAGSPDAFDAVPIVAVLGMMALRGTMTVADNAEPRTWPF